MPVARSSDLFLKTNHAQLDQWVADYEAAEERKQQEQKSAMGDDGWTVVVRSKVRGSLSER